MQSNVLKKALILSVFLGLLMRLNTAVGQDHTAELQLADSLFDAKEYPSALRIYERIFFQTQQASPSMLLRMAYIREGTNDYTDALYYLNLYYVQTPQASVAQKMEELAAKYQLTGYVFRDSDLFSALYGRYYLYIVLSALSIGIVFLYVLLTKKFRREPIPLRQGIGLGILLLVIFFLLNLRNDRGTAIIAANHVYLMNAPAAGANLIAIVQKGHRVDIRDQHDVWLEIEWNGQPAYIPQHKVRIVSRY